MTTPRPVPVPPIVEAGAAATSDRLGTGIEGLDRLLDGGLVRGNSLLIEGPPGSGKSTLGVRILHEGIVRHREPGLVLAFEEFPRQIYREALSTGVDLRAHEDAGLLRVLWMPPARVLEGIAGRDDLVDRIVKESGVKRLLIDSITHFKRVAASELELREILATLLSRLKLAGVSAFLVKEMEGTGESGVAFEEYLVDASVRLYHDPAATRDGARVLEVRKTRGQAHLPGRHPFDLGPAGFAVWPRVRAGDVPRLLADPPARPRRRVPTGVPGLDDRMGGGLVSGTLALVTGESGSGRTSVARQFLRRGVELGEEVLLVSLRQTLSEPSATPLPETTFDPHTDCIEMLQNALIREVSARWPHRIAFDGLDDLRSAVDDDSVRQMLVVLGRMAAVSGATLLVTDGPEARDDARLASCVVRLESDGPARTLRVTKHAGSTHVADAAVYHVGREGLRVAPGPDPALTT